MQDKLLKEILHTLPFVHFWGQWEDINEVTSHGHNHQVQRCTVCNKARKRWYDANSFL